MSSADPIAWVTEPNPAYFPRSSVIQASGTCGCEETKQLGTLGPRVDFGPGNQFCFLATCHGFDPGGKTFIWAYMNQDTQVNVRSGQVPAGGCVYQLGPDGKQPYIDAALIQLTSNRPGTIASGVFNITDAVSGTSTVDEGDMVVKYGIATGLTYGLVIPLPTSWSVRYDQYLFAVERCDEHGNPIVGGLFSEQGDSGAPVMIKRGNYYYVAGTVLKHFPGASPFSIANKIAPVEARLNVNVHEDH